MIMMIGCRCKGHHHIATLGKLLTPACLCHKAVQFGVGQAAVMLFGWETNHGPGRKWRQPNTGFM